MYNSIVDRTYHSAESKRQFKKKTKQPQPVTVALAIWLPGISLIYMTLYVISTVH